MLVELTSRRSGRAPPEWSSPRWPGGEVEVALTLQREDTSSIPTPVVRFGAPEPSADSRGVRRSKSQRCLCSLARPGCAAPLAGRPAAPPACPPPGGPRALASPPPLCDSPWNTCLWAIPSRLREAQSGQGAGARAARSGWAVRWEVPGGQLFGVAHDVDRRVVSGPKIRSKGHRFRSETGAASSDLDERWCHG